ncbi:hypothetical protein LVB77_19705 [Lysobacter sp. 5GHs7-4]|uniref:hypothetical protein n=1 Tax=Lysobacter sp. 5GHs7-4 TaxID=2904253 RepID=UPI001E2FF045|nr:hypothetical protein [Lysobacter sp. 5GHs7-4]UHQ22846.1 hypothetical protein LVB77_19705 [Lysobacter sp. 5GHs7-4]
MNRAAIALGIAATLALSACSTKVHKVVVREDRLQPTPTGKKAPRLTCAHQLADVVDARPAGNRAGGLGAHQFLLDDAPALVRKQLLSLGMTAADAPADADARRVAVQIKQLYLSQNTITKVPVAVYSVQVDGAAPFVIRAQAASMNWNSSEDEAYRSLSDSMHDANLQLVNTLNKGCGARKAG